MAQISRPFQLALVLVAVLALAWFAVLHAHLSTSGSGSSGSGSSTPGASSAPKTAKAGEIARDEGKATPVYHGAAPGLQGLSRDIRRAHETVGASEAEAHKLEGTHAVSAAPAHSTSTVAPAHSKSTVAPARPSSAARHGSVPVQHPATATHSGSAAGAAGSAGHSGSGRHSGSGGRPASRATTVESQLHAGKTVLLLFWNPASSEDREVHGQVQAVGRKLKAKVALDFAKAGEVGSFGTVTRDVSVLQTPTLLIINKKGLATTITGLTDAFSIEQAVREAGA